MACGGSKAMRSRLSTPTVSPVEGSAITRMSVSGSTLSKSESVTIRSKAGSAGLMVRRTPQMDLAPIALARWAKLAPISPVPSTVMFAPQMERTGSGGSHTRSPTAFMVGIICRSSISVTIIMCSAMVTP